MYPTPTQKAKAKRADSPQQASTMMGHRAQHAGGRDDMEERENRRAVRLDGADCTD